VDKSVIFAVAGSGKTYRIVQELDENKRFLIVTYTDSNRDNLRERIIGRFGHMPENISLYTYFTFLHTFCYRPFLLGAKRTKGMTFIQQRIHSKAGIGSTSEAATCKWAIHAQCPNTPTNSGRLRFSAYSGDRER